jgi:spermidine synthase
MIEEPRSDGVRLGYAVQEVLMERQTPYQHLMVATTPCYGRALFLDHLLQSAELDECIYHEMLIHPAMVIHGHARRVLVAGAGEGATLRELLRHPGVSITTVDLDEAVIEASKEHLHPWHEGAFDDPRVELRVEDIEQTLAATQDGHYDLIVLDITDPVESGPSVHLFAPEFFQEVRRCLADDGMMVIQAGELNPTRPQLLRALRSTLLGVYPWIRLGHAHVPSFHCPWAMLVCAKTRRQVVPKDIGVRIERVGPTAQNTPLRAYSVEQHRAFFALPRLIREAVETRVAPLRSDGTALSIQTIHDHELAL